MPCRFHRTLAPLFVAALAGVTTSAQPLPSSPDRFSAAVLPEHHVSIVIGAGAPAEVTIASAGTATAVARLTDTADRTLRVLAEWLGPPPTRSLRVVDLPWGTAEPGASYPAAVATRVRLFAPVRDVSAERSLIAGMARQFWLAEDRSPDAAFREGLTLYTATRAIHAVLEGRNFASPRYFGGFIPVPLRSLLLTPNVAGPRPRLSEFDEVMVPAEAPWRFASAAPGSPARRTAAALLTLERMIGWPAMQQLLSSLRLRSQAAPVSADTLTDVLAEQRGVSMKWFARDVLNSADVIDYAVAGVNSETQNGTVRTTVVVERRGRGVFSGTDVPRSTAAAKSVPVLLRFSDGTEVRGSIDGRDDRSEVVAASTGSPIATVIVDPESVLMVEENRSNNGWSGDRTTNRLGMRLMANWIIWLQHVMLSYSALA